MLLVSVKEWSAGGGLYVVVGTNTNLTINEPHPLYETTPSLPDR